MLNQRGQNGGLQVHQLLRVLVLYCLLEGRMCNQLRQPFFHYSIYLVRLSSLRLLDPQPFHTTGTLIPVRNAHDLCER